MQNAHRSHPPFRPELRPGVAGQAARGGEPLEKFQQFTGASYHGPTDMAYSMEFIMSSSVDKNGGYVG